MKKHSEAGVSARLDCGAVLAYDASSFAPAVGEEVPCRSHGYCAVSTLDRIGPTYLARTRLIPPRRTTADLVVFLGVHRDATIGLLRRHRFTLRLVVAAQAEGLVDADLIGGRVRVRQTTETDGVHNRLVTDHNAGSDALS